MRIISFAWTTEAFLAGTKTVTRRMWKECNVKPDDLMQAWDKSPRAGGKRIGTIKILRIDREPLHDFEQHGSAELKREGGYWKTPGEYITQFLKGNPDMLATDSVWRIEFERYTEKQIVVLARSDYVDNQGDQFTDEALRKAAEQFKPVVISHMFDRQGPPMGLANSVFVEGDELRANIVVDPYLIESCAFRPGGMMVGVKQKVIDGKPVRVIEKFNLLEVSAIPKEKDKY